MKIKTSEATELQLDWLVAKCEGVDVELIGARMITERRRLSFTPEEMASLAAPKPYLVIPGVGNAAYSTDWSQGGPIIERKGIGTFKEDVAWVATLPKASWLMELCGPTPLIAGMRCYVASELGDEVEIPEELT